jgi:hypothetical protein
MRTLRALVSVDSANWIGIGAARRVRLAGSLTFPWSVLLRQKRERCVTIDSDLAWFQRRLTMMPIRHINA